MSDCGCSIEVTGREQARVLIALLAINAIMFVVEIAAGFAAESTGLVADSLDMLADAVVYGIGLYAVGRSLRSKIHAALASGFFQTGLALLVAFDIARRAILGSEPEPAFMIGVSIVALAANIACLAMLARHREGEVHMRASWIFSRNDVIANTGVIAGGLLVYLFGSNWPDLVIGALIVFVVFRGGLAIIADARAESVRNETLGGP